MIHTAYSGASLHDARLREAYKVCLRLLRRRYPSESDCLAVLPAKVLLSLSPVLASGSVIDDLSDNGAASADERAGQASAWIRMLEEDIERGDSTDPVRRAMAHLTRTLDLPADSVRLMHERIARDAVKATPQTWQEWAEYQRAALGPILIAVDCVTSRLGAPLIMSAGHEAALVDAMLGFQLTDDLTDFAEDLERGYVKLPAEALDGCGVSAEDLLARRWTPATARLVRAATERARAWLQPQEPTVHWSITSALLTRAFTNVYLAALHKVERAGPALLSQKVTLSSAARQRILLPTRAAAAVAWKLSPYARHTPTAPTPHEQRAAADLSGRLPAPRGRMLPPAPHPSGARPPVLNPAALPRHVAVIMDGNGRWAADRALPRAEGYRAGANALRDVVDGALEIGLPCLTVYAFSTENWNRSSTEVEAILDVVRDNIADQELFDRDLRFCWAGVPDGLPKDLVDGLRERERTTQHRTSLTFTMCVNYGGRSELAQAARSLARAAMAGEINPAHIDQRALARHLPHPVPDVDLLWRTGGEQRTSNFLPWQSSYAELLFTPTYWPDIDRRDLWQSITTYTQRQRRYGTAPIENTAPMSSSK
ncbi:polyprenyl diphosphate synthase [Streptomyces katrae]|uniref:polyprenyl diphosphate synthase n=1 Tax=Streptomyces katrae TaxID=68223 RepID=UPI00068B2382|nr:polyprenyl diphosphate synthase [Streptomyces katrae]